MWRAEFTNAEQDGVGHIDSLKKALPAWVVVLELLHSENEVRDDEEQHDHVERKGIPDFLEESLQSDESGLAAEVHLPLNSQFREHFRHFPGVVLVCQGC